jgi:hypothetical protein
MKLAIYFTGMLGLSLVLIPLGMVAAQEPENNSNGIAVQSRGPVHEAFAELANLSPQPGPIAPKQPPDPIPEAPPDQKPQGDNVQWIPGYWAWDTDQNNFLWVSGFWRVPPPDRQWVPGYWSETQGGWQWTPGMWAPAGQQQPDYVPEAPPDSLDNGPSVPAPDENSFYIPGAWLYQSTGFAWRPGYWSTIRPGYCWTPAHYDWTPAGYCYVSGYWDYPLEDRGLLFAPVAFTEPLWTNPSWFFRPSYCVDLHGLLSSLFCRPLFCHYYYGDYFGRNYYNEGFYPWFAYGRRWHSPLFGYYNWQHRGERGWYNGLVRGYRARVAGELPRQTRPLVAPLHELRSNGVRLAHVSAAQVNAARQRTSAFHAAGAERQRAERSGRFGGLPLAHTSNNRANFNPPQDHGRGLPHAGSQPQRSAPSSAKHFGARPNAEFHAQPHGSATFAHSAPANIRSHQPAAPAVHHEQPRHVQAPVHHESRAAYRPATQPHRSAPARSAAPRGGHATPARHSAPASHGGGHNGGGGTHGSKKH